MRWTRFSPEGAGREWDSLLAGASDDNPFQSIAWGRHKSRSGWEPERWIASGRGGEVVCSVQLLRKPLPLGRCVIWAPGGPVIGFPGAAKVDLGRSLREGLRQICLAQRAVYARFYILHPLSAEGPPLLCRPWTVPRRSIGSGSTVLLDLSASLEQLQARMTGKHRHLARRLEEVGLQWRWGGTDTLVEDLGRLHAQMSAEKKVRAQETRGLAHLISDFRENALILAGYHGAEPVTACLVLLKGTGAFYWRAATARKGRELSAAYGMILKLLELLKDRGIERFDFGGILPDAPSAAGINHFKRGFGGRVVVYSGEWEWASHSWIRRGVNAWVAGTRRW